MAGRRGQRGAMPTSPSDPVDSPQPVRSIPGLPETPAFVLQTPAGAGVPVLIAVPHAGRAYPPGLTANLRDPAQAALRLEDRLVDLLAAEAARRTGASLLVAQAPRAMIDLNRHVDDVDWGMVRGGSSGPANPASGRRARSGLGLVPRRVHGLGDLWRHPLDRADLAQRIAQVHRPYHKALGETLRSLRDAWGVALLIDLHSMPPLALTGGEPRVQFVLGDRFGAACDGGIVASGFSWFAQQLRPIAHNRPYAGGYVLDTHSEPHRGIHGLQLEIDRSSYLDASALQPGAGFADIADLLAGLIEHLANHVIGAAGMAQNPPDWSIAAE